MKDELISVIIPVYKVEPYLAKCVDSVLAQTYQDLEIILVDDGSPDGCPALCDAYGARDSRVKVIHKPNGGLSSARNAGLDIAGGAYIGFVDSDDYIAPDMYEKLYAALTETGADMSVCGCSYVDEAGAVVRTRPTLPRAVLTTEEVFQKIELPTADSRFITVWNRLCRREMFEGLRFRVGKLHEDEFLMPGLLAHCTAAAVIPEEMYFYLQRRGSQIEIRSPDRAEAYLERYAFYLQRDQKKYASAALRRAYGCIWEVFTHLDAWGRRREFWPWVRRIMAAQIRELNPSAAVLGGRFVLEMVRCRLFGRRNERGQ